MSRFASLYFVLVVLLASFFCIYAIGEYSFGEGDQSTHTLVVQDMFHSGSYLNPTLPEKLYFNKPPLKMWLATLVVGLLGESNFSFRLLDGLLGIGVAILVFRLAVLLFSSEFIGLISVLNLMGTRLFLFGHGARVAVQDTALLLLFILILINLYHFLLSHKACDYKSANKQLLLIGLWTGLAMMCKGAWSLYYRANFLAFTLFNRKSLFFDKAIFF